MISGTKHPLAPGNAVLVARLKEDRYGMTNAHVTEWRVRRVREAEANEAVQLGKITRASYGARYWLEKRHSKVLDVRAELRTLSARALSTWTAWELHDVADSLMAACDADGSDHCERAEPQLDTWRDAMRRRGDARAIRAERDRVAADLRGANQKYADLYVDALKARRLWSAATRGEAPRDVCDAIRADLSARLTAECDALSASLADLDQRLQDLDTQGKG